MDFLSLNFLIASLKAAFSISVALATLKYIIRPAIKKYTEWVLPRYSRKSILVYCLIIWTFLMIPSFTESVKITVEDNYVPKTVIPGEIKDTSKHSIPNYEERENNFQKKLNNN